MVDPNLGVACISKCKYVPAYPIATPYIKRHLYALFTDAVLTVGIVLLLARLDFSALSMLVCR